MIENNVGKFEGIGYNLISMDKQVQSHHLKLKIEA